MKTIRTPRRWAAGAAAGVAVACVTLLGPVAARASACGGVGTQIYPDCLGIGYTGCCTLKSSTLGDVTTLQWCDSGVLCMAICDLYGAVCGWEASEGIYDCVDPTYVTDYQQLLDPSGQHPWPCDIPCGDIGTEGCC